MAAKKKKRFRIELGWPGLIFTVGLLLCLFLWMFVLGFYFGQKVVGNRVKKLSSPVSKKALTAKKASPPPVFEEVKPPPLVAEKKPTSPEPLKTKEAHEPQPPQKEAISTKLPPKSSSAKPAPSKATTKTVKPKRFYTVQVASMRSPTEAQKFVKYLREKGYEAFYRKVILPQKGTWYRVYVGRFKSLSEARAFGEKLKKKEKFKAFYIQRLVEK